MKMGSMSKWWSCYINSQTISELSMSLAKVLSSVNILITIMKKKCPLYRDMSIQNTIPNAFYQQEKAGCSRHVHINTFLLNWKKQQKKILPREHSITEISGNRSCNY